MSKVRVEAHGDVALIRLDNQVTNAINPSLAEDLSVALHQVRKDFKGLVLAGGPKFFSMGFDLPTLLKLDRAGMTHFFYAFDKLTFELFTLPMPTVCALSGHAIAGGCVLALTADYRVAAAGKKLIGVNEVKLGIPVPYLADLILRQLAGDRAATNILYHGEFISMADARQIGVIDELVPEETVEARALEMAARLAALPRTGFAAIKANRVEAIRGRYEQNVMAKNDELLDAWFSEPVQALLAEAAAKF